LIYRDTFYLEVPGHTITIKLFFLAPNTFNIIKVTVPSCSQELIVIHLSGSLLIQYPVNFPWFLIFYVSWLSISVSKSLFSFFLLLYWGYTVTFTEVLSIHYSWIHPLHHSPLSLLPHSWNSFNRSHFSIYTWVHNISTTLTLLHRFLIPSFTGVPELSCSSWFPSNSIILIEPHR
jgi:hypothetical protein